VFTKTAKNWIIQRMEGLSNVIGFWALLLLGLFIIICLGWAHAWKEQKNIGKFLLALFIGGSCIFFSVTTLMK